MKKHIVWSPSRGLPTKTHASEADAKAEALRLASRHPGVPFDVYALVGSALAEVNAAFTPAATSEPAKAPEIPLLSDSDPVPSSLPVGWVELTPDTIVRKHDLIWGEHYRGWADGAIGHPASYTNMPVYRHSKAAPTTVPQPKPSPVAEGFNPKGLTVEEVGEGWRLLTELELGVCDLRFQDDRDVYCLHHSAEYHAREGNWRSDGCVRRDGYPYRTKKEPGYFLFETPKPYAPACFSYVPACLPPGSSAGAGFRFLRDTEEVTEDDEGSARRNFAPGKPEARGWMPARVLRHPQLPSSPVAGFLAGQDDYRVYRRPV